MDISVYELHVFEAMGRLADPMCKGATGFLMLTNHGAPCATATIFQ